MGINATCPARIDLSCRHLRRQMKEWTKREGGKGEGRQTRRQRRSTLTVGQPEKHWDRWSFLTQLPPQRMQEAFHLKKSKYSTWHSCQHCLLTAGRPVSQNWFSGDLHFDEIFFIPSLQERIIRCETLHLSRFVLSLTRRKGKPCQN